MRWVRRVALVIGVLVILVVTALVFIITNVTTNQSHKSLGKTETKSTLPSYKAKYITANPINLTQIEKISKFRSCAGHDNSGHNFLGEAETDRSMKHYVKPLAAFANDKAALYAPFDGSVYEIEPPQPELGPGKARGGSVSLLSPLEPNAVLELGHINTISGFKKGDAVKSGQLLGYAATAGGGGNDFDLILRAINQPAPITNFDTFDLVFNHMTPAVLAEYEKVGLTKDALFFSKEYRDANPCLFGTVAAEPSDRTGPQPDIQTSQDNWVVIKK